MIACTAHDTVQSSKGNAVRTGVRKLEIQTGTGKIKGTVVAGMYSGEGEFLPFPVPVPVHGCVDAWMAKVESTMFN